MSDETVVTAAAVPYTGPERRKNPVVLSEAQVDAIAEKAAQRAIEHMTESAYKSIGKTVVGFAGKALVIVGVCFTGLYLWLKAKGLAD